MPATTPYSGPTGADFVPFAIGYVRLGGELEVESRLADCDARQLVEGMEMELVVVPFRTDEVARARPGVRTGHRASPR